MAAAMQVWTLAAVLLTGCQGAGRRGTAVSNHTLNGVVTSVDGTRLVVTRASRNPGGEMTFVLTSATHRDGPIGVGATVQVRFRTDGRTQVATAVMATSPKETATANAP